MNKEGAALGKDLQFLVEKTTTSEVTKKALFEWVLKNLPVGYSASIEGLGDGSQIFRITVVKETDKPSESGVIGGYSDGSVYYDGTPVSEPLFVIYPNKREVKFWKPVNLNDLNIGGLFDHFVMLLASEGMPTE